MVSWEALLEFWLQRSIDAFQQKLYWEHEKSPELAAWHDGCGVTSYEAARHIACQLYGDGAVADLWPVSSVWGQAITGAIRGRSAA